MWSVYLTRRSWGLFTNSQTLLHWWQCLRGVDDDLFTNQVGFIRLSNHFLRWLRLFCCHSICSVLRCAYCGLSRYCPRSVMAQTTLSGFAATELFRLVLKLGSVHSVWSPCLATHFAFAVKMEEVSQDSFKCAVANSIRFVLSEVLVELWPTNPTKWLLPSIQHSFKPCKASIKSSNSHATNQPSYVPPWWLLMTSLTNWSATFLGIPRCHNFSLRLRPNWMSLTLCEFTFQQHCMKGIVLFCSTLSLKFLICIWSCPTKPAPCTWTSPPQSFIMIATASEGVCCNAKHWHSSFEVWKIGLLRLELPCGLTVTCITGPWK